LQPISELLNIDFNNATFSAVLPVNESSGLNFSIASSVNPFNLNSSFTFSIPILSSLSMATVISIILSEAFNTSAMPANTFRLLINNVTFRFK
jgi:hypothetical protein